MSDLARLSELVIRELRLQRLDHPSGEALPDESEDRLEGVFPGEAPSGHGMDVGPVDHRADEPVFVGELGDVPEASEGALLAGCLQTQPDSEALLSTFGAIRSSLDRMRSMRTVGSSS